MAFMTFRVPRWKVWCPVRASETHWKNKCQLSILMRKKKKLKSEKWLDAKKRDRISRSLSVQYTRSSTDVLCHLWIKNIVTVDRWYYCFPWRLLFLHRPCNEVARVSIDVPIDLLCHVRWKKSMRSDLTWQLALEEYVIFSKILQNLSCESYLPKLRDQFIFLGIVLKKYRKKPEWDPFENRKW